MALLLVLLLFVPAVIDLDRRFVSRRLLGLLVLCGLFGPRLLAQAPTPVTVPTWRYDLTHEGQNTNETALTPENVNETDFGKLFSVNVDGRVYAQPLYIPGLMAGGQVHNVLYVATEHDSIYAFDADSNTGANASPLWKISLLDAAHGAASGATTVPQSDTNSSDIGPEFGITSTPVIDPSSNTMYVVGITKESGNYIQRLHAINILTGAEMPHSPVVIQASVAGTGTGSSGGQLPFIPLRENQRSALNFYNGHVYVAFGSHGDQSPFHGWIFVYDGTTLTQTAKMCLSPDGSGDSIWASGAGMPIDTAISGGRMFIVTGNGTYGSYPPYSATSDLGDSVIALGLADGKLTPTDAFTPFNQAKLSSADQDQGSGGILMLPDQPGTYPHMLIQAGKEGRILVLNRDNLGGYAPGGTSNTNALQDIPNKIKGLWSTAAYWNGNVYFWGAGDLGGTGSPMLFKLNDGVLDTTPSSTASVVGGHPGGIFTVSSNGANDGIAWTVATGAFNKSGNAILYAWDATDLTHLLYESDTNSTRDSPGEANKFAVPVVTNGKVYVTAVKRVTVYGLLNATPAASAPVISPDGGSFTTSQKVTLSSATRSADIYYTLDGTMPTPSSTLYTSPITISSNTTLKAIATADGFLQSTVSSATFTFGTPTPTFQPGGGTYSSAQSVALNDTDSSATIYYTTDGSTPTASSTAYTGPISVATTTTVKAIAIDPSLPASAVVTATYTIGSGGGSSINFGSGFASTAGLQLNGSASNPNNTLQLTPDTNNQTASVFWTQPIGIQTFTTDFTFQLTSAQADGITFTIQNVGTTAIGPGGAGLGYGAFYSGSKLGIAQSVAIKFDIYNNKGEGPDSTGVYTDGASPTVPATDMTASGVILKGGDVMHAHITYDGTTLSMTLTDTVTNKSFTLSQAIDIPGTVGANTAYVGFTASTGVEAALQKILTWTYTTP